MAFTCLWNGRNNTISLNMANEIYSSPEIHDFEALRGKEVIIHFGELHPLPAKIISLVSYKSYEIHTRTPFSVIFRTAQKEFYFQQGIYNIELPEKSMVAVFLVPLGPDQEGMKYEAVFN